MSLSTELLHLHDNDNAKHFNDYVNREDISTKQSVEICYFPATRFYVKSILVKFRTSRTLKAAVFCNMIKLILRKIWMEENFINFHTVIKLLNKFMKTVTKTWNNSVNIEGPDQEGQATEE